MSLGELHEIEDIEEEAGGNDQSESEIRARRCMAEFKEIGARDSYERLLVLAKVNTELKDCFIRVMSDVVEDAIRCGSSYPDKVDCRFMGIRMMMREGLYPTFLFVAGRKLCGLIEAEIRKIRDGFCFDVEDVYLDLLAALICKVVKEMRRILEEENCWKEDPVRVSRGSPPDPDIVITVTGYERGTVSGGDGS